MKKIRKIRYKKLNIERKWLVLGLFLAILSFFVNIWPIVFLGIFCIANSILLSIDRYVNAPLDLEFSTFSSILMTISYGLKWGIATALLTKIAAIIYNKRFTMDHVFMMIGYSIAALMANILSGNSVSSIVLIGIIATLATNLWIVFVSKFITGLSPYEIFMYGSSNIIFNAVLFIGFSEFFLKIMMFLR